MMTIDTAVVAIASASSAAIFAGSAAMKFAAPMEFRGAVENYRIVPEWAAAVVGWTVPMLELAGAAGIMLPAWRPAAALCLLSLLTIFTAAVALNLARGRRNIDCGCFGPLMRQQLSGWMIARNAMLAMLVGIAAAPENERALSAFDYATMVPAVIALVMLYAAANYLLANAPTTRALRTRDA
jgi:uncharacterized membrane protein